MRSLYHSGYGYEFRGYGLRELCSSETSKKGALNGIKLYEGYFSFGDPTAAIDKEHSGVGGLWIVAV